MFVQPGEESRLRPCHASTGTWLATFTVDCMEIYGLIIYPHLRRIYTRAPNHCVLPVTSCPHWKYKKSIKQQDSLVPSPYLHSNFRSEGNCPVRTKVGKKIGTGYEANNKGASLLRWVRSPHRSASACMPQHLQTT